MTGREIAISWKQPWQHFGLEIGSWRKSHAWEDVWIVEGGGSEEIVWEVGNRDFIKILRLNNEENGEEREEWREKVVGMDVVVLGSWKLTAVLGDGSGGEGIAYCFMSWWRL